jgi:DNA repair protein RecO
MGEKKTLAILLQKKLLPNDDVILEFLTMEFGKITVFAKSFLKSKQRNEVDFFRVIELGIFQGRSSKSLKKANTISLFHNFSRDFSSSQIGFSWLEILAKIIPEEEIDRDLFKKIIDMFSHYSSKDGEKWDAFFKIKMLDIAGFWPKLDKIRSDIFFDPYSKSISREIFPEAIFIKNIERQTLEFLRRANLQEFLDKKEKLKVDFNKIFEVIFAIESFK